MEFVSIKLEPDQIRTQFVVKVLRLRFIKTKTRLLFLLKLFFKNLIGQTFLFHNREEGYWNEEKDIALLCWFHHLHNENHRLGSVLQLTRMSMKRKCCISYGHCAMATLICLCLFGRGVNNDQNTHGLLSSHPPSLSASLTHSLHLIPCTDDDREISFSYCLPPHSDKCTHQLRPRGQAL